MSGCYFDELWIVWVAFEQISTLIADFLDSLTPDKLAERFEHKHGARNANDDVVVKVISAMMATKAKRHVCSYTARQENPPKA